LWIEFDVDIDLLLLSGLSGDHFLMLVILRAKIHNMKLKLFRALGLLCMLFSTAIYAQQNKKIQLIDKSTQTPIVGAKVMLKKSNTGAISGTDGVVILENVNLSDSVVIRYPGYASIQAKLGDLNSVLELDQSIVSLNKVIVTGTRDAQNRSEVPLAISTLNATVIDEAKATSTEQLLNKTPGVFMADLGNEQHSMAIRQPLSYKSLFLYLEDGIPIRTTGIFNHNALLEMNMASFQKIEIVRGPSSSLYGSEAIGGAINFITVDPSVVMKARAQITADNLGLKRGEVLFSDTYNKVGVVLSGNYSFRTNGYREHSDYEKLATSLKVNYKINDKSFWSNSVTYIDYRADMTGSLDSLSFFDAQYSSLQRFTDRDVTSLRAKSSLNYYWSKQSKSTISAFFRNNSIKQNPSYRIKDDYSPWGNPDGDKNLAHSEKNDNSFNSYGLILNHKKELDWLKTKITGGLSLDYSPSSYYANYISVYKSDAGVYESYEETDSVLTNYHTDLINTAAYLQLGFSPIKNLRISGAVRFDHFIYNYDNELDSLAFSGAPDERNQFSAFTPKVGFTYTPKKNIGIYGNYSQGFVPPQVSELYRGVSVPSLEPAVFTNTELGSWINLWKDKASLDLAVYRLVGLNEIISVQQASGDYVNENAGKTLHQGIEYGLSLNPVKGVYFRLSGTNAIHEYSEYIEKGNDYSGKIMPRSPNWICNSEITYKPHFMKGFRIGAEWQHVGPYYMDADNTIKYEGFDVFNLRVGYKWKGLEAWCNVMNIADVNFATNASKSAWGQNYSPGNPRTFSVGLAYTFQEKIKGKK
jgi:outer membrane receptor protein involved in Fe transport